MRLHLLLALIPVALLPARTVHAQAARIGRLPLLELPAAHASCTQTPANADLRRDGIAYVLNLAENPSHRLLSIGVDRMGRPRMLLVMSGTSQGRRSESESITALFGENGLVAEGSRSANTGGTPARLAEDRWVGLAASDTAQVLALAQAIRRACRG